MIGKERVLRKKLKKYQRMLFIHTLRGYSNRSRHKIIPLFRKVLVMNAIM